MTFEIFYAGAVRSQQIFYSSPKNYISPLEKYDKFIQEMDALTKEIKQLKTEEDIEEKEEEMVALVQKEFTQQDLDDCCDSGDENYNIHDPAGRLEVDDEEIENYKDFFGDEYEKWEKELSERLEKLDWYIIYDVLDGGVHTTGEGLEIEGEFDKKKITMKDNCLHYDDEPIISPDGTEREGTDLSLYVGGKCIGIEPVWAEEEDENKEQIGEGFFYSDEKKYCFMKRSAADVEVDGEFFTFTPGFGKFREIDDLWEYLKKYIQEKNLKRPDVNVEWLRHCIYEMDPETMELGEFLESSGIDSECYAWNPETKEFDEKSDEEEEED